MRPLSDAEITDLLCQTHHGPWPKETQQRVMATLEEVPRLREQVRMASAERNIPDDVRQGRL